MVWYVLALLAAFFSASAAIFEKKVLFKENALSFSFILAISNFILAGSFLFFVDFSSLTYSGLGVLFFKSILGAVAFLCVMIGIKNLEISKALPFLVLTPGLVAFFAWVFLGEDLSFIEIGGMGLLLGGTYILQSEKIKIKKQIESKGLKYIIVALVLFTLTSILDKALLKNFKLPVNAFMGFQHLFLALIFFVFVLFYGNIKDVRVSFKRSFWIIFFISCLTIGYRYAHIQAIKVAPVALVLSLKRVSVFFAVLIGGKLFREKNLLVRVIATCVMVAGAIMVVVG